MSHPHPDLDYPKPLAKGAVRVVPLGGLGEIGRNMTVFEHAGRRLSRPDGRSLACRTEPEPSGHGPP